MFSTCCTLTTGILTTIAANAAEEMKRSLPFWRTIKISGELNDKYPGGSLGQKKKLEKEGHDFIKKGRKHIKYLVKDFKEKVIPLLIPTLLPTAGYTAGTATDTSKRFMI